MSPLRARHGPRRRLLGACLSGLVLLAGCGSSGETDQQRAQKAVAVYEREIAALNVTTARTSSGTASAADALQVAIRRYSALDAPEVLAPSHRRVVSGLRRELRAVRAGLRGVSAGDSEAIATAARQNRAAQRSVLAALDETLRVTSLCRVKLSACTPAATPSSGSTGD